MRGCTESADRRCWSTQRAWHLNEVVKTLNMLDPSFEFQLVNDFVGLVPAGPQKQAMRERFGDPTSPSSWEGQNEHIAMNINKLSTVLGILSPTLPPEEPSVRYYSKKAFKYLVQHFTPGCVRFSNAFADPKYLGPVKGMFAEVPNLGIMFVDATTSNVTFPSVATLMGRWTSPCGTSLSSHTRGHRGRFGTA